MVFRKGKLGEFALIDQLARIVPSSPKVIKGIGDDAAVLSLRGNGYELLTTDMLVEGVHFRKGTDPRLIGRKALACNVSDIAAMGGVPTHAVVSIAVPKSCSTDFVENVYYGIGQLAREFDISIVGGDTVASGKFLINIALMGQVPRKFLTLRSGAKFQDWIWVTGALGRAWKTTRHLTFTPRVRESQFLVRNFKPSAMM
ncbi:MAG: thiamine-monophosphate kinase, partial [Candidatus Omnitrophica bacterium]|nr:thiamine-monophosphate kinase [Candidatus Omnitrophota bacterium]